MIRTMFRRWLGIEDVEPLPTKMLVVSYRDEPKCICRSEPDVRIAVKELELKPGGLRVFKVPVR